MPNTKESFDNIDIAADKAKKERNIKEAQEFERRRVVKENISKCEFRKHVSAMYHPGRCEHPDRSKEDGTRFRNCLKEDCPLMK